MWAAALRPAQKPPHSRPATPAGPAITRHARENSVLKIVNSLQTKLIISFVALIVVIAGGTYLYTFGQTKSALLQGTRDDLVQMIGMASTQFSAEEISQIQGFKAGQDQSASYLTIKAKLQKMRAVSPNISNFYIMQIRGDQVVFLVDDAEDEPAAIGEVYEKPEAVLFHADEGIQVSPDLYTDEWGTYLSAYAPIQGTSGTSTLIVGADILSGTVVDRENFIGNTIYLVMGLAIVIAGMLIGLLSLTIIRDIKKLNKAAEKISMGDTDVTVDVHRRDEIGELANSFARMVASLKIMMAGDDQPK
jgi:HAMP domain-containing protein